MSQTAWMLGSIKRFYQLAWNGPIDHVFARRIVRRDDPELTLKDPIYITVLTWQDVDETTPQILDYFHTKSIYIRDELQDMLKDVFRKCRVDREIGRADFAVIPDDVFGIVNPFLHPPPTMMRRGVSVTGSAGVGKSVFLLYVLALRLLAKRPAVLVLNSNDIYIFSAQGVQHVESDFFQWHRSPITTWFLVDCSANLQTVPHFIINAASFCKGFIVQAASSRADNHAWLTKADLGIPPSLYMRLWSVRELIDARDLQKSIPIPNEKEIGKFVKKFGSAPCYVYGNAGQFTEYEKFIENEVNTFDLDKLKEIMSAVSARNSSKFDPIISHLVHAIPAEDNRQDASWGVPTRHLTKVLHKHFTTKHKLATRTLYEQFVSFAFTRPSAGYLLERLFMEELPNGGEWGMTKMIESKEWLNFHWKYSGKRRPDKYLRVGYKGRAVVLRSNQAGEAATFSPLKTEVFGRLRKRQMHEAKFFIPKRKNHPSFDAFIYDPTTEVATLFKVTVGKNHVIKEEGLSSVAAPGIKTRDLVVVTCAMRGKKGGLDKIVMNSATRNMVRDVYHLILGDNDRDISSSESDSESERGSEDSDDELD